MTNAGALTVTGAIVASNFSGSSSGTNTGDQTNISGTAANVTGIVASANGGTGVNNGGRTLTIATNSGTIGFTNASTTLTVANNASISGTNTGDQTTITGNAGSATYASAVTTTAENTGTTSRYILFADSVSGNQALKTDTGLTYHPTNNALTASTFVGALTGNADTATTATTSTYIGVSNDTENYNRYVGFFESNSGNRAPKVGSLTYNPSLKKLGGVDELVSSSGGLTLGDTGPYTFIRLRATEQDAVLFDNGNVEMPIIDFNGIYVGPINMNNQRNSITAFTLAANTESSEYYIGGYKFATIHLFSSSDSYTMMVWETRIDLTDPNQYTYNATRYRRIYWNTGSSSASGNFYSNDTFFVIGTGTSGYVKFKHNGGAGFRYKITLEK